MSILRNEIILEGAYEDGQRRASRIIVFDIMNDVNGTPVPEYSQVNNILEADNDYKVVMLFGTNCFDQVDLNNLFIINPDETIRFKLRQGTLETPRNIAMCVLRNIKPKH